MSWLRHLFQARAELPPDLTRRLETWRKLTAVTRKVGIDEARLVVVDVETSGLNARRDRLLAIGAVAIDAMRLRPGDGLQVIVRHDEPSPRSNILVHGIGPQLQASGAEPEEALIAFLEYARKDPLVAFHAAFDRTVLERALRRYLGVRLPNAWLDVALLAPALFPEQRVGYGGLDEWLHRFGLRAVERHRAADDAFATGELLLALMQRARARGVADFAGLQSLAESEADLVRQCQPGGA